MNSQSSWWFDAQELKFCKNKFLLKLKNLPNTYDNAQQETIVDV